MVTSWQIHHMVGKTYVIIHNDAYDNVDVLHGLEGPFDNDYTARMWIDSQVLHSADTYIEVPEETLEEIW